MLPDLPAKGTITTWLPDDSIGRIRLSSGEEVRFGHSACVDLRPSVGVEVWVTEIAPHPLGGLRAKVVNATGAPTPDRASAALSAHALRERLRPEVEAEVKAVEAECAAAMAALPSPFTVARGAGIDLAPFEGLRVRLAEDELAAFVSMLSALDEAGAPDDRRRLFDWEWADAWPLLQIWTDPCFVPIGAADVDHVGLFAHPALTARGLAHPVVLRTHETSALSFVAESGAHFVRMVDAAARGEDPEPLRGARDEAVAALLAQTAKEEAFEDVERKDVHALFWSGSRALEAAAAERLAARYGERGWQFAAASIAAQRALAGYQDRIDAARSRLEAGAR